MHSIRCGGQTSFLLTALINARFVDLECICIFKYIL